MGAETSIVIKATDRYSDTVKRMCETTRSFSKDVDSLEEGLYSLSKNKYTLKVDVRKAKDELRAAEKQFSKTHSEADGLRMELAQANYDNTVRNLKAVSNAAKQTESEIAKLSNRASGGIFSRLGLDDGSKLGKGLANSGLLKMVGSSASGFAGALIESAIGQPSAMFMSSIASGVAAGASAGAILGPAGALIGAGIGAVSGGINGYTQIYEAKDDAFKGYVQNAVEGQLEAQNKSLTDGSALAAARETDQISFATLFKSEDKARTYRKAWLIRVTINFARNTYRGQKRNGELDMDIADEDQGFARVEAETDLRAALERMRPEYREVICLYYLQELSVKMVAEVLDRNESTVRTQLSRAREQLRNFLEG